jgi:hypothetical protein
VWPESKRGKPFLTRKKNSEKSLVWMGESWSGSYGAGTRACSSRRAQEKGPLTATWRPCVLSGAGGNYCGGGTSSGEQTPGGGSGVVWVRHRLFSFHWFTLSWSECASTSRLKSIWLLTI